jgi:hypothetical protein
VLVAGAALGACSVSTTGTDSETTASTLPVDLLHDRGRAAEAMTAIERAVGATPAQSAEVLVYPQYMNVDAQDPKILDHINTFEWRDGTVSGPDPVHLSGPQENVDASLFPTSAIRWSDLPEYVSAVEAKARHARPIKIEGARASYVIVQRSTSPDEDGRIGMTIYLEGPRRSGRAELTASGEVVSLQVD